MKRLLFLVIVFLAFLIPTKIVWAAGCGGLRGDPNCGERCDCLLPTPGGCNNCNPVCKDGNIPCPEDQSGVRVCYITCDECDNGRTCCFPTPTPGEFTAQCLWVKTYRVASDNPAVAANWSLVANPSTIRQGEVVYFTVAGQASSGSFDKAVFIVNGTASSELTAKKPKAVASDPDEFYYRYQIPTQGVTSFTVSARVHHHERDSWFPPAR